MKPIQELGLELIELEDQVLLVESKVGNGKLNDWVKLSIPEIQRVEEWNKDLVLFCNKIVASTKQLEGLPLLVIEDEVEKWINESTSTLKDVHTINISKMCLNAGYNKAKETFKFTEEDLRKAIQLGSDFCDIESFEPVPELVISDFIQSLTKKELWVEVDGCSDCHLNDGYMSSPNCCREVQPKITNNQIKAVWK